MFLLRLVLCFGIACDPGAVRAGDFARDVLPVLQRACFECHGAKQQKGGLRLDSSDALRTGGDSGDVLSAGTPDESELLRRIRLPKGDPEVMPNRGDVLTAAEIERIRAWIAAGAAWPEGVRPAGHWAYIPPVKADLPRPGHPVDAFIRSRLEREGLAPSPPADPAILARRLSLDVVGLPPTPRQVEAFVAAARSDLPKATEAFVDELLASPQYGEKWARPWLDAARYADSHGFQRDDLRDLWPYRDWVIRALNADMPFDRFTIEQLAGDLLPDAEESQRIATGFNRCAPCNVEAGTDPEENRVNQVLDRVNTLGAVWLGTTLECAQCHDHKYDPVTQQDYYGLFAYFNSTEIEADRSNPNVPGSIRFLGPYLDLQDPPRDAERARITAEIALVTAELNRLKALQKSAAAKKDAESTTHVLKPVEFDSAGDSSYRILDDGSVLLTGDPPEIDTYTVTVKTALKGITGFKLEPLTDPSLPGTGPGRGDPQRSNFVLHEFSVAQIGDSAVSVPLRKARAGFSQQKWPVSGAIDGKPKTGWAIAPQFHRPHWATFETEAPLGDGTERTLRFTLVQNYGQARTIGRFRISAFTGPVNARPDSDETEVVRFESQLAALQKQLAALSPTRTLIMQELAQPRASTVFVRGDFRSPGNPVEPSTPAFLPRTPPSAPKNRLELAQWLVSAENPLTARVAVNRVWQEIFGEGLVSTPEDFGLKGEPPVHPELLDWLAVEFRERGWSQKLLLRTILTSETYRQSSRISPLLKERDPRNRLLARGPRFRLTAEGIRDNALAISGLLSLQQFGPPIRPPQPEGLWNKVGGQKYEYVVSPGSEQHRRGLYVVLKRMSPYPTMTTFDATARLACRVKRLRSNTPLQALALLNDPVSVECAQALATRIVRERTGTDERLQHAFRLAVARSPSTVELDVLRTLHTEEAAAAGEDAAWLAVATTVLNLDETITKE